MILEEALEELSFFLKRRKLLNVCVGVNYTSIILDDQNVGLSNTIYDSDIPLCGKLLGLSAYEAAQSLNSNSERSLALAVMNAITLEPFEDKDPLIDAEGKLCVFGYSPSINRGKFSKVIVYDFSVRGESSEGEINYRPFSSYKEEKCNVAVLFGSVLVNGSVQSILKTLTADTIILSGVSAIFAPITLRRHGFTHVSKYFTTDNFSVFRIVCEGGGPRQLGKFLIKRHRKL